MVITGPVVGLVIMLIGSNLALSLGWQCPYLC
jgi:hypothetical protein